MNSTATTTCPALMPSARSASHVAPTLFIGTMMLLAGCNTKLAPNNLATQEAGDTSFVSAPAAGLDGPVTLTQVLARTADQLDLGMIQSAAFGPNGTLWVYDQRGKNGEALLVFDSLGKRIAQAGRNGEGPGEYHGPAKLFRLSDSTMLLRVMNTARVVRFGARGEVLATLELPPAIINGWLVTPDTSGGWYLASSFEENTPKRVGRFGWIHFAPDGTVRDTVFPPARFFEEATPLGIAPGRVRTVTREGDVLTALPATNRIDRIAHDGHVTAMTWPGEAPSYTDQERKDIQHVSDRMNDLLGLVHVPLPSRRAAVHLLMTLPGGGVWAMLGAEGVRIPDEEVSKDTVPLPPMKWTERERWGSFDREGKLRYIVDMPVGAHVLDHDATRLLGVTTAADGSMTLVVWRLGRSH